MIVNIMALCIVRQAYSVRAQRKGWEELFIHGIHEVDLGKQVNG